MKARRPGAWAAVLTLTAIVATAAPSQALTATPSPTDTASPTTSATSSPSAPPTATPPPTGAASATPTGTASPSPTGTATAAPTPSPSTTTAPTAPSAIQVKYAALGGAAGALGAATGDVGCALAAGGCAQTFQNGTIIWSSATGAHVVWGAISGRWVAAGAAEGFLGYPTTDELAARNGGVYQAYQGGAIYWSPKTGAHSVGGAIRGNWAANGYEGGVLGFPTTEEVPIRNGGVYQLYQGGAIMWSPTTGAHTSVGAVRGKYGATGYEAGFLGYPTTDEVPLSNGGVYQLYQNGAIYWSPMTGAHPSGGAIRTEYAARGYENGVLGYPATDEGAARGGGAYQHYQGGSIYWSPAAGTHTIAGGIRAVWAGSGWENGSLGYPVSNELCDGSACIQRFQGGTITWVNGVVGIHGYNECESLNNGRSQYPSYGAAAVSFAIAESYGSYNAWFVRCQNTAGVYWPDWYAPATVGRSGFKPPGIASGPTRYEYSPTGDYSVTQAFGLGNPGTALPYQTLNPSSRWGGNPWTATYNQYFESSSWTGYDENMWYFATRSTHDYRQGAVINYNRPPDSGIVQDAGFAIFLHENTAPTAGCIALPESILVDWLQKARSGDRIIMGVRADLFH